MAKVISLLDWLELSPDVAVQRGHETRITYRTPDIDIEFNRYAFSIINIAWSSTQIKANPADFVAFYKELFQLAVKDEKNKPGLRYRTKLEEILEPVINDRLCRRRIISNCSYKAVER